MATPNQADAFRQTLAIKKPEFETVVFHVMGKTGYIPGNVAGKGDEIFLREPDPEPGVMEMKPKKRGKKMRKIPKPEEARLKTYHVLSGIPETPGCVYGIPSECFERGLEFVAEFYAGWNFERLRFACHVLPTPSEDISKRIVAFTSNSLPEPHTSTCRIPGRGNRRVPDTRHRAVFRSWELDLRIEYDRNLIKIEELMIFLDRMGSSCGVGDWRRQKGGDYGSFYCDGEAEIIVHSGKSGAKKSA